MTVTCLFVLVAISKAMLKPARPEPIIMQSRGMALGMALGMGRFGVRRGDTGTLQFRRNTRHRRMDVYDRMMDV